MIKWLLHRALRPGALPFTFAGRCLALVSFLILVGGTLGTIWYVYDELPGGSYPIVIFEMIPLAAALLFFGAGCAVLRVLGIEVFTAPAGDDSQSPPGQPAVTYPPEECPWCEAVVVLDADRRCPACGRPV